jgi:uncharacterized DUF497 family protein
MKFDWDPRKAVENAAKHGVSFDQAIKAFDDPNALFFYDIDHSEGEMRENVLGAADDSGIVLVVYTVRVGDVFRIISAREATRREKLIYGEY